MPVQFGNTWWGQAYLGALTHIDYENRLARGKSYARNDKIKDISIHDNIVEAKVQGSRPKPYKVKVIHVPMMPGDQKKLTNILVSRPDLTSEILNLRLPQEVLDICRGLQIQLFPASWHDIKLTCSCPDWAVPCKHIAAVIYTISNEIDKDPFMIFKLLNYDLGAALLEKGVITQTVDTTLPIPTIDSLLSDAELVRGFPAFDPQGYALIDLSTIPKLGPAIPQFLDSKPVFYTQGDFSTILEQQYNHQAKFASKEIKVEEKESKKLTFRFLQKIDYLEIVLDTDLSLSTLWLEGPDESLTTAITTMEELIEMILRLRTDEMIVLSEDFKLLRLAWEIAIHLVRSGAIVPAIFELPDKSIVIRWQPATNIEAVRNLLHSFQQILRQDFISLEDSEGELFYLNPIHQPNVLVGLFIQHLVLHSYKNYSKAPEDTICEFFFDGKPQSFSAFSDKKMGAAIYQWVGPLRESSSGYHPRIWIHEKRNSQFELEIALESNQQELSEWVPLSEFMESNSYQHARTGVLKTLSQLGARFTAIREAIKLFGKKRIPLQEGDVIQILGQVQSIMQLTGTKIILPKSLEKLLRPKTSLQIKGGTKSKSGGQLSLDKILSFEWTIAMGDHFISPEEFRQMVATSGRLIKIKDQYVILDKDEVDSLLERMAKSRPPSGIELLRYAVAEEYEGASVQLTGEVKTWLQKLREEPKVKLPAKLKAKLRPYQIRGYGWLWKNAQLGFGSILADDMGLGKTLQVLSFLQKAKEEGWLQGAPVLIVGPATILTNWIRECERFTPDLNAIIYHGPKRALPKEPFDLLITTYGLVRSDQKKLSAIGWSIMIIDEAQNIKNTAASQTHAVWELPAKIRIAMSGTPVENRLSEYYSISQFANPGYLGTQTSFRRDFSNPIEQHRDHQRLDVFKRMTAPFLLRRVKTDKTIINDLPEKIVLNRYTSLTPEQASIYEATTKEMMDQIKNAENTITRRGLVLKLFLQLKQICNHPVNFLKRGKKDADRTGKTEALREVIELVRAEGQKVLIFTQYREMGDILLHMLREWGEDAVFLHGGLSRKDRDEMVTSFQEHQWPSILILSIKAAGTGLNLTAATHVIHYDLWWNPAVEAQATDRAFRIGQKHNVTVHRIITRHTLEENIDQLIQSKKELADLTVSTGEKWIGELSDRDIEALVGKK